MQSNEITGNIQVSFNQDEEEVFENDHQWLAHHLHLESNDEIFTLLSDFVLLWSLFENEFFDKDCKSGKLEKWVAPFQLPDEFCDDCIRTLKGWYLTPNGSENESRMQALYHNSTRPTKSLLISGLESDDISSRIRSIAIAVYRYRNNMFHGEKEVAEHRNRYRELFTFANRFLRECLQAKNKNDNDG